MQRPIKGKGIERRRTKMPGTYKVIELVGTSPASFAEAVKAAVAEASRTVRHMDWFEVVEERGRIADGQVQEFQVTLKVGFKIEQ
jgi:flavin-binding protein dodecin